MFFSINLTIFESAIFENWFAAIESMQRAGFEPKIEDRRHWNKEQMLRAFNPKDVVWKHKTTSHGRAVFNNTRKDLLT